jgi:hypothetical protein
MMRWLKRKPQYRPGELIYKGALAPDVVDWVRSAIARYPFPVEVYGNGDTSMLPQYEIETDDCMGRPYTKKSQTWECVPVEIGTFHRFYFFPNEADKDTFVRNNQVIVLDEQPFKTAI